METIKDVWYSVNDIETGKPTITFKSRENADNYIADHNLVVEPMAEMVQITITRLKT